MNGRIFRRPSGNIRDIIVPVQTQMTLILPEMSFSVKLTGNFTAAPFVRRNSPRGLLTWVLCVLRLRKGHLM